MTARTPTSASQREALRSLPSIHAILNDPEITRLTEGLRPEVVTTVAQRIVDRLRTEVLAGISEQPANAVALVRREIEHLLQPKLTPVINGTGVIIHTNLGRAPVSSDTAVAMAEVASHYTPLELEIESGKRGGRMAEISRLMTVLAGAESTLVVNNNAAAVLLTLSALCAGRDVILSRSQAVEIGGGFRVPDVMAQGGARLVEVGTTNRTYARDYEAAINEQTGALLAVHWSNFRIIGFTAQPGLAELSEVSHRHGLPLLEDLGSGALADTAPYGLLHEPTVGESLVSGVDVVCFSGDKLLGGPQAGIISGRADLVARIAGHPLSRAVRADKTALAGVAATLRHYLRSDYAETIPIWRMISVPLDQLERRCRAWLTTLDGLGLTVVASQAAIGGGSLPGETLESRAIALDETGAAARGLTLDQVATRLRHGVPSLMPHVEHGRLLIDARTILPEQDEGVVRAVAAALDG